MVTSLSVTFSLLLCDELLCDELMILKLFNNKVVNKLMCEQYYLRSTIAGLS